MAQEKSKVTEDAFKKDLAEVFKKYNVVLYVSISNKLKFINPSNSIDFDTPNLVDFTDFTDDWEL